MLSRETLISMLKNEYPESYNSHDIDNMGVKELDDLLDFLDSMQNKANGGMMLDNTKTYHQANDYTAPPDLEVMIGYANGGGVGSMMVPKKKKNTDTATDGNIRHDFKNFKKGTSVNVPTSFQARSHSTPVNLAYITDDEAGILKALKPGTPHEGPMGIPNYDSFDAGGNYTSGTAMSAAETGSKNARDRAEIRASNIGGPKGLAPGVKSQEEIALRNAAIVAGAGQRVNPGFFDSRNTISPYELAMAKASNPKAFNKIRGTGGIMGFLRSGGLFGNLLRGLGQKFGWGKTYDQPTYDMSEFSDYGLGGTAPGTLDFDPNAKIQNTSFINKNAKNVVQPKGWTIQDEMVDVSNYNQNPWGIQEEMVDVSNYNNTGIMKNTPSWNIGDQFLNENPEVRNMLGINRNFNTTPVNTNTYEDNVANWRNQNNINAINVGLNQKQKDLIDKTATTYSKVNAASDGTPGKLDQTTQRDIFNEAKNLDTKAESGWFGTSVGETEADPMTQQEYKDYLVSKGYV